MLRPTLGAGRTVRRVAKSWWRRLTAPSAGSGCCAASASLYQEKVGPADLDLLFAASDIDVATEETVHRHASRHQELKDAATRQPTAEAVNRAEAAPKS